MMMSLFPSRGVNGERDECVRVWVEEWDLRALTVFGGELYRVNKRLRLGVSCVSVRVPVKMSTPSWPKSLKCRQF